MNSLNRKYQFSWNYIGDLKEGRPNLGKQVRLEVYRLMQYTFRDIVENKLGTEDTDKIFFEAGKLAGCEFYQKFIPPVKTLNEFVVALQNALLDFGIGILRIEKTELEKCEIILTVSEDLDCSGLPEDGNVVCKYDEGFVCGLLESFTNKKFDVKEIDCWCTGDRTCRFLAKAI